MSCHADLGSLVALSLFDSLMSDAIPSVVIEHVSPFPYSSFFFSSFASEIVGPIPSFFVVASRGAALSLTREMFLELKLKFLSGSSPSFFSPRR